MSVPHSLVRSALLLTVCVVTTTLLLMPVAFGRVGTNGPMGLLAAALLILLTGWAAESISFAVGHGKSIAGTLFGMGIRMLPPLALCAFLAARGEHGREHLPFIGYLLTLYLVTLALETWLAVRRLAEQPSNLAKPAR